MTEKAADEITGPGHKLLQEWAEWTRGGQPGEHHQWCVQERIDPTHPGQPPERVMRVERILSEVFRSWPQYRRMVKRFYLDGLAVWDIAQKLKYTAGFVRMSIQAVADLVERRNESQNTDRGKS